MMFETAFKVDIRPLLREIKVPTLVLHRMGDRVVNGEAARYLAGHIPGTRFVELVGDDHVLWVGDVEPLCSEIEVFLTGSKPQRRSFWRAGADGSRGRGSAATGRGHTEKEVSAALFISPRTALLGYLACGAAGCGAYHWAGGARAVVPVAIAIRRSRYVTTALAMLSLLPR